jgi:antitoxin VapB
MARASVFKSNTSQAIRLPKAVALPEHVKQVEVVKVGSSRVISPAGASWTSFFEGPSVSEDFMRDRNQPPAQRRVLS